MVYELIPRTIPDVFPLMYVHLSPSAASASTDEIMGTITGADVQIEHYVNMLGSVLGDPSLMLRWTTTVLARMAEPLLRAYGVQSEWTWKMLQSPAEYFGTTRRSVLRERMEASFAHFFKEPYLAPSYVTTAIRAYMYWGTEELAGASIQASKAHCQRHTPDFEARYGQSEAGAVAQARRTERQKVYILTRLLSKR